MHLEPQTQPVFFMDGYLVSFTYFSMVMIWFIIQLKHPFKSRGLEFQAMLYMIFPASPRLGSGSFRRLRGFDVGWRRFWCTDSTCYVAWAATRETTLHHGFTMEPFWQIFHFQLPPSIEWKNIWWLNHAIYNHYCIYVHYILYIYIYSNISASNI